MYCSLCWFICAEKNFCFNFKSSESIRTDYTETEDRIEDSHGSWRNTVVQVCVHTYIYIHTYVVKRGCSGAVRPKCYSMRQRLLLQVTRSSRRLDVGRPARERGVRQICMRINTGNVDRNNIRGWRRLHLPQKKNFLSLLLHRSTTFDPPPFSSFCNLDASTFHTFGILSPGDTQSCCVAKLADKASSNFSFRISISGLNLTRNKLLKLWELCVFFRFYNHIFSWRNSSFRINWS